MNHHQHQQHHGKQQHHSPSPPASSDTGSTSNTPKWFMRGPGGSGRKTRKVVEGHLVPSNGDPYTQQRISPQSNQYSFVQNPPHSPPSYPYTQPPVLYSQQLSQPITHSQQHYQHSVQASNYQQQQLYAGQNRTRTPPDNHLPPIKNIDYFDSQPHGNSREYQAPQLTREAISNPVNDIERADHSSAAKTSIQYETLSKEELERRRRNCMKISISALCNTQHEF